MTTGLLLWWLSLYGTFSSAWPRPFDDWKNGLFYIGAGVIVLFLLWSRPKRSLFSISWPCFLLLLYTLAVFTSLLGTQIPRYEGFLEFARLFLWGLFIWALSRMEISKWEHLMKWAVISAAIIAVISGVALHVDFSWLGQWGRMIMPPIGYVAYYGDFMALHLPMAFFLLFKSDAKKTKFFWGLCCVVLLAGLWLTGARASLVGLLVALFFGIFLMAFLGMLSWKKVLFMPFFILLLALFLNFALPSGYRGSFVDRVKQLASIKSIEDVEKASSSRWHTWVISKKMIFKKPWQGWGLSSFRFVFPENTSRDDFDNQVTAFQWYMHPHNELLHQWVEVGFLGLFSFLALVGIFYAKSISILFKSTVKEEKFFLILGLSGLTLSLVSWEFNTNFLFPLSRLLTAFYVAILWKQIGPHFKVWATVPIRGGKYILIGLTVAATVFLGAYHISLYATQKSRTVTTVEEQIKWTRLAYQLAPGAFDPLLAHAAVMLYSGFLDQALPLIDSLYEKYPYVPLVLYHTAVARLQTGRVDEARSLLHHAVANDLSFREAKILLDRIKEPPSVTDENKAHP